MDMNGRLAVYVIFNPKNFTKEDIVSIIKEEGYPNDFFFATDGVAENVFHMDIADEVWTFGEIEDFVDYKLAKDKAKDIWQMG